MTDNAPQEVRGAILMASASVNPHGLGFPLMTVIRDNLPQAEFDRYVAGDKLLDRIIVTNLFTYYVEAFKSFVELWKQASETFAVALPIGGLSEHIDTRAIRLRGAVLGAVSMLCYHQERTLQEACDNRNSEQHLQVKAIFSALYDDYFGYRFLVRLRNVMVHDTIEAVSLSSDAYRNNGQPFAMVNLDFCREVCLKSPKINATLKAELASKPGDPSVMQMMMEIHRPLLKANRQLLAILHPDLTDACNSLVEFDDLFEGKEGTRGLIHQLSPELRAPFTSGFRPISDQVLAFARSYTTEDWVNWDTQDS